MSNHNEDNDDEFEAQYIVVNPEKLFPNDDPNNWANALSRQGMLKVELECQFDENGIIQGNINFANPPGEGDEYVDAWEGSKGPGEWDFYSMLGFRHTVMAEKIPIQLFFKEGTFFERDNETISTVIIEQLDVGGSHYDSPLEAAWGHIYSEVFVKHFDGAPLAGHKWATCPCGECSSPTSKGTCSTPTPI